MTPIDLTSVMLELLMKDRLDYMKEIMNSEEGARSFDIATATLRSKGIAQPEKIKIENIKVNKRLRKLVDLGILVSEEGKYKISSLGQLLMTSWGELGKNKETLSKFHTYFDTHYVTDLPQEFFCQIYKLEKAEMTEDAVHWMKELMTHTEKTEHKLYNLTEHLHSIQNEVIERKKKGKIEQILIVYQFFDYPKLNYKLEEDLFDELVDADAEFRCLTLENKHSIGIRIVDEKWAIFGLTRIADGILERGETFFGTDREFVSWCRDLFYHIWHFEAKPLDLEEVIAKK